jgi:hypothetical protein
MSRTHCAHAVLGHRLARRPTLCWRVQVQRLQREKDESEVDAARMHRDLAVAAAKRRSFSSKLAQVERLDAARERTLSMIQGARALNPSVSFALPARPSSGLDAQLDLQGSGNRAISPKFSARGDMAGRLSIPVRSLSVMQRRPDMAASLGEMDPVRTLRPYQSMAGARQTSGLLVSHDPRIST